MTTCHSLTITMATVLHSQSESMSLYLSLMTSSMELFQGKVATVAFSQKLEDSRSFWLHRMKNISNQLGMRNLEMIYGNKKKLRPKMMFTSMSKFCFYIFQKFTLRQKYPATTGNWHSRKMGYACIRPIYWWDLYCLVCKGFWWTRISIKNTTYCVSCYNFHGASCYIVIVIHWV